MRGGLAFVSFALVLAGCAAPPAAEIEPAAGTAQAGAHVLANAAEPAEALSAATFRLAGAIASGGPVYGAGEPGVAAAPDGTIYVTFPGCDRGIGPGLFIGRSECPLGLVYRSADDGATFERLNGDDGQLAEGAESANGDADIAVDFAGNVYISNLGDGIPTQRSRDGGATWEDTGNVVPEDSRSVDRNWLAAGPAGNVIHNWMGGPENEGRQVGIASSFDGGDTWSNVTYLGVSIGWQGSVQFGPDGVAYLPFTEATDCVALFCNSFELFIARSIDGGLSWTTHSTGVGTRTSLTSFHFSGMMMVPSLDVTGDGQVVYVYSEEVPDPLGVSNTGAVVKLIASADQGVTWSAPLTVSTQASAIMPWVVGGAGDRVAIAYLASDVPGDPDRVGLWSLVVATVDGVGAAASEIVASVVDGNVHQGGICSSGGICLIKGSDRALLDYLEADVLPDGRIVVAYPADPAQGGKMIEIRFAIQDGGSRLLATPAQP